MDTVSKLLIEGGGLVPMRIKLCQSQTVLSIRKVNKAYLNEISFKLCTQMNEK